MGLLLWIKLRREGEKEEGGVWYLGISEEVKWLFWLVIVWWATRLPRLYTICTIYLDQGVL